MNLYGLKALRSYAGRAPSQREVARFEYILDQFRQSHGVQRAHWQQKRERAAIEPNLVAQLVARRDRNRAKRARRKARR